MTNAVSGMAASIRAATDSEMFDLAGHDATNINHTINDAFSEPFQLDQMIRITFVTGAGKLSRQKYDGKAMPTLTSALRQLDYAEDRGASCVNECGGTYKTQHDTGKNLLTVVVFPRLVERGGDRAPDSGDGASPPDRYPMPFPLIEGSPAHAILLASEETFEKMAPSMNPSWSEKKSCSEVLKAALETIEKLDAKLMSGAPLSGDENAFYDAVGGAAPVAAKAERLGELMRRQVEAGPLNRREVDRLSAQVRERIEALDGEIGAALLGSREKKAARLDAQRGKAEARERMLRGRAPQPPHGLKHEAQILKLRKRLKPLMKLEESTKGRLLSMKETKELAAMEDMLEEISELEEASRGWFEDDDVFRVRLEAGRKKLAAAVGGASKAPSGGKGKKPATASRSAQPAWLTSGGLASKQASLGKRAAVKKKPKPRSEGGSAFAAMMLSDSDSDSD